MLITADEFLKVENYLFEHLTETGQNVTKIQLTCALVEFNKLFEDGVLHMSNFIEWMQMHGYDVHAILPTLVHDLNGMHDNCFLPRTSSY